MGVSTLVFMGMSFSVPRPKRIFHYITAGITLVACIAYFTMASNLGYAAIPVEFRRGDPKVAGTLREIFYVRYIDWFVTTPVSNPFELLQSACTNLIFPSAPAFGSPLDSWSPMAHYPLDSPHR